MSTPLPTLVLMPGLDGTGELFAPFQSLLEADERSVVMSYPRQEPLGYDALEERVRAALPSQGPFLVLAQSFSGPLAIRLAARPPAGMLGLALVATFAHPPRPWPIWLARLLLPAILRLPPWGFVLRALLLGSRAEAPLVRKLQTTIRSVHPRVLTARLLQALSVDERQALASCQLPVLYVAARHDRLVPARVGHELQGLLPSLQRVELEAPHMPVQTQPPEVLAALRAWWEQTDR